MDAKNRATGNQHHAGPVNGHREVLAERNATAVTGPVVRKARYPGVGTGRTDLPSGTAGGIVVLAVSCGTCTKE